MRFMTTYNETPEAATIICKYFSGNESAFTNILSYDNVKWESALLNLTESVLSEKEAMSLHYDMIINGGREAVNRYHRSLASGKNLILEKAKAQASPQKAKQINEAISKMSTELRNKFSQVLNENTFATDLTAATADPQKFFADKLGSTLPQAKPAQSQSAPAPGTDEFSAALAGGSYTPKEDGGVWGFLKSLWLALTEDGSAIGIIHLVLDILGVIGDASIFIGIPGGGAAFDILNAIIYFIRGKWLLGTISLIAGILFGAGDILKGFKGVAVPMEKVMVATVRGGAAGGAVTLGKLPAKEYGLVIKGLRYIAKNISGVLGKAVKIFGAFSEAFVAKLVGWVPFIGKPLKEFFEKMGQTLTKYGDEMTKFASDFSKVEKEAVEAVLKESDAAIAEMLAKGGSMTLDPKTGIVKCLDASGNQIGKEFSAELLTNPSLVNKKYPNLFKKQKEHAKEVAQYYTSVARTGTKLSDSVGKSLVDLGLATTKQTGKLAAFIGKQIIKYITGKDWQSAGYTEAELNYWGNSALQSWIQQEIDKKKKETGATYLPALDMDSRDQETFERITNYQNEYAELFGQPHIIPVIYDKYGNKEVEEEFEDFWKAVAEGKVKREEPASTKSNESFRYIIPFSKFITA